MSTYDWERLTSDVVCRFSMHPGKPLLPWPELPQNLAFLAHVIDAQARWRKQRGMGVIVTPIIPNPLIDQVAAGLAPVLRDLVREAVQAEMAGDPR